MMTEKMSNLDKFNAWAAAVTEEDLKQMVYNGRLNKAEIAQQAGFSYSAWKAPEKNPTAKALHEALYEFEATLEWLKFLPEKAENPLQGEVKSINGDPLLNENRMLKKQNSALKDEIIRLKAQLDKLSEMKETVIKLGLMHVK
ncbi:hypothetical protein [Vibrio diabolicus]|uniref:hypothetical protein n=1 Tax=Vibrio diabolicus TaxID=50719 RepID=UPI0024806D54|nr:hypothetical protein [Vibrio diabolicus]